MKTFDYQEDVGGNQHFLWGNTAYAFATRLTDSFAKYRWCANIIGPQGGGAVDDLPLHPYEAMGEIQTKIPTEVLVSERREYELAEEGFIALTMRKGSDNAAFFSANSGAESRSSSATPRKGKDAELNYKLGTQLPYMIDRQPPGPLPQGAAAREHRHLEGAHRPRDGAQQVDPPVRGRPGQPGRRSAAAVRCVQAEIERQDVEGEPGWYRVGLKVRPHFKYMGAEFTLSLVGKLDKE